MISTKTRVMLWGRAAGRCSLQECRRSLVLDETETDDPSLVGEVCHIVAESTDGPRGSSSLTAEERDKYGNLILLCKIHHKMIDDQPLHFTVDAVHEIKDAHEKFVGSSFDANSKRRLADKETVAGYVDYWMIKCDLDNWKAWVSWLLSSNPSITVEQFRALEALQEWLLSRVWPVEGFAETRAALNNFRRVVNGFLNTFRKHYESTSEEPEHFRTKEFYRIEEWDEDRYHKLLAKYERHNALVEDYVLELTRAANHVCDCVRTELLSSFRLREGLALVTSGPGMDLRFTTYRTEYQASDYPLLFEAEEQFNLSRLSRDVCFGTKQEAEILDAEYKFLSRMFD
jgi:hypothetical protein